VQVIHPRKILWGLVLVPVVPLAASMDHGSAYEAVKIRCLVAKVASSATAAVLELFELAAFLGARMGGWPPESRQCGTRRNRLWPETGGWVSSGGRPQRRERFIPPWSHRHLSKPSV